MDYKKMNIENAEHYGFAAQSNQLVEEMAELMVALNKYKRALTPLAGPAVYQSVEAAKANVIEEIADVEVMLEQIKYLMGIAPADVEETRIRKIIRTASRRNGEKRLESESECAEK